MLEGIFYSPNKWRIKKTLTTFAVVKNKEKYEA